MNEELHQNNGASAEKKEQGSLWVYELLHDFALILAAVTIIFVFLFRLVGVDGSSMFPTLNDRDFLLLKSNVIDATYEPGDIVVLRVPEVFDSKPIVKRVIATEGMEVYIDFSEGKVYVDGVALDEPYVYEQTYLNYADGLRYPVTVPKDCIFVMGDNRNNSTDSRYAPLGMVDKKYVMGKVQAIVFPGKTTDAYNNVVGGRDFKRFGGVK